MGGLLVASAMFATPLCTSLFSSRSKGYIPTYFNYITRCVHGHGYRLNSLLSIYITTITTSSTSICLAFLLLSFFHHICHLFHLFDVTIELGLMIRVLESPLGRDILICILSYHPSFSVSVALISNDEQYSHIPRSTTILDNSISISVRSIYCNTLFRYAPCNS